METKNFLENVSSIIDSKDSKRFSELITEDGVFRFGNAEEVKGRKAIEETVEAFFKIIKACKHEILNFWEKEGSIVWEGKVTYTRADDKVVSVNFANIFYMKGELIEKYYIFIDNSPLFA
ncbi:MAG: nuclear transport factor 2 family protein [Ignavibacteria bacterium]|nr:nuclear transport factor 2 family protein [Ignavibacteria bacterium]